MVLQGSGRLLVLVRDQPFLALLQPEPVITGSGYTLRPLSPEQLAPGFDSHAPGDYWLLAEPVSAATVYPTPWDRAHAFAAGSGYAHFVEPDVLHVRAPPPAPAAIAKDGLPGGDPHWPPYTAVSPAWHLGGVFADFDDVRNIAKGEGVWIAHLDTGYRPDMGSNPIHLHPELGKDFWSHQPVPVDDGSGLFPGHGTATAALLAGGEVTLDFAEPYTGVIGGAPEAEVIPIRISNSVIHLWTASMAQGIDLARIRNCDVASISHGGVPSVAWADAVNKAYDSGVVIVGASGDSIYLDVIDLATRYTVYPSAFNRVITALGATYEQKPYITTDLGEMQECWGPDPVMAKAICGYSPNILWMDYKKPPLGFRMRGAGTSVTTPQVAAACALWLQLYQQDVATRDWRRIEAVRHALFESADKSVPDYDQKTMGQGILRVPALLDGKLAKEAIAKADATGASQSDSVESVLGAIWDLLTGAPPPGSEAEEQMYKTETAQILFSTTNRSLRALPRLVAAGVVSASADRARYRQMLHAEVASVPLRRRLPVL